MKLFNRYAIELVNEETGQVVTLTMTIQSYKELAKYLSEIGKKKWTMLTIKRKES